MFYKTTVLIRQNSFIRRAKNKIKKILGAKPRTTNADLVRKYVTGKIFADVGALWGVNGLNSFVAEESKAKRVIAVDIYPASEKFNAERKRRNSKVEFVQGDIHQSKTANDIGLCDVVLCSGVLYHTPDPIHLLTRLHEICKETLILNTASIPEIHGIRNAAVLYPFLDAKQRRIWNLNTTSQIGITGPYEPKEGYANWFWGMTPSCIESMLKCAGFEVIEKFILPFDAIFVCKAVSMKLEASSGEWTLPKARN